MGDVDSTTHCPQGHKLEVIDSKPMKVGWLNTTWRRKRCVRCGYLTKTLELPIELAKDVLGDDE